VNLVGSGVGLATEAVAARKSPSPSAEASSGTADAPSHHSTLTYLLNVLVSLSRNVKLGQPIKEVAMRAMKSQMRALQKMMKQTGTWVMPRMSMLARRLHSVIVSAGLASRSSYSPSLPNIPRLRILQLQGDYLVL